MTKPLWQQMIDQSDMALGARPARSYSADDALIARAHLVIVIRHIRDSDAWRNTPSEYRDPLLQTLVSEMLAANVTDGDSTTDHSPSAS
jgi:hypothetical protein